MSSLIHSFLGFHLYTRELLCTSYVCTELWERSEEEGKGLVGRRGSGVGRKPNPAFSFLSCELRWNGLDLSQLPPSPLVGGNLAESEDRFIGSLWELACKSSAKRWMWTDWCRKVVEEKVSSNARPVYWTVITSEDAGEWGHGYL